MSDFSYDPDRDPPERDPALTWPLSSVDCDASSIAEALGKRRSLLTNGYSAQAENLCIGSGGKVKNRNLETFKADT